MNEKRILSLLLAAVMILSLGICIFNVSAEDGFSFTRAVARRTLKMEDGTTIGHNKIVIANSRSNSILDGTVPLLINGNNCYYNIVLTLP